MFSLLPILAKLRFQINKQEVYVPILNSTTFAVFHNLSLPSNRVLPSSRTFFQPRNRQILILNDFGFINFCIKIGVNYPARLLRLFPVNRPGSHFFFSRVETKLIYILNPLNDFSNPDSSTPIPWGTELALQRQFGQFAFRFLRKPEWRPARNP